MYNINNTLKKIHVNITNNNVLYFIVLMSFIKLSQLNIYLNKHSNSYIVYII